MRLAARWTLLLILGLTGAAALGQQDVPGSADHPMISRFKGSAIIGQERKDFDAYTLPLGPPEGDHFRKQQNLEGKITRTLYLAPAGSSALLVYRNYENALKQAGFQTLFACAAVQCRGDVGLYNYYQRPWMITPMGGHSFGDDYHVLVTKLPRPTGDVYVSLCSGPEYNDASKVYTAIDVVEVKPMAAGLVTVNAAELANDISQTGHASIYGIYFDTGKAELKPESDSTLAQIAKLLATNPALKLHVVGHTDNVGAFAANMTLSKQRADAVVATLLSKYHASAARLQAAGVGPLAPVASNKSEEGRARNRRVELVEQ